MAVDANVLIFERIREELRTARGPARAIELGFDKAQSPILDGNLTALIVAGILYAMGGGPGARLRHHAGARPALLDVHRDLAVAAAHRLLVRLAAAEDGRDLRHTHATAAARSRRHQLRLLPADALLAGGVGRSACSLTLVILPIRGLNYGVDFLGGTLILAEFPQTPRHRRVPRRC